jgi:hypothetical protein
MQQPTQLMQETIMKLRSEPQRIEVQVRVSHREVEGDGNAEIYELSLDELSCVAGGSGSDYYIKL